jgi:hypothetical protein
MDDLPPSVPTETVGTRKMVFPSCEFVPFVDLFFLYLVPTLLVGTLRKAPLSVPTETVGTRKRLTREKTKGCSDPPDRLSGELLGTAS